MRKRDLIFVIIVADDLERAVLDVQPPVMPSLSTLIAQAGATFANAFVNVPLCAPSRATILTGRYAHNTGVLRNDPRQDPAHGGFPAFHTGGAENSTIATWLRATGYDTALIGKYMNHYPNRVGQTFIPPGWSNWVALHSGQPSTIYVMNDNGVLVSHDATADDDESFTDLLARESLEFIDDAAEAGRPFFLLMTPFAPHSPAIPASRHAGLFSGMVVPRTASLNEADVSDKPPFLQRPLISASGIAGLDASYRNRLRTLRAVDEAVLAIYRRIESLGQLGRTYFVFTSDNGYHLGQHRLTGGKLAGGKETTYDEDLRVPLLVRGPGIPARLTVNHLASLADLAPTVAAWAGITPTGPVDGRSLVPVLKTTQPNVWRQSVLIEHWAKVDQSPRNLLQDFVGFRTMRYSYARYPALDLRELYDMRDDPSQLTNIAATASAPLLDRLDRRTTLLATCAGATCRSRENTAAP